MHRLQDRIILHASDLNMIMDVMTKASSKEKLGRMRMLMEGTWTLKRTGDKRGDGEMSWRNVLGNIRGHKKYVGLQSGERSEE